MMKTIAALVALVAVAWISPLLADSSIKPVLASDHRTPEFVQRDRFRHPAETLAFFELKPDMNVVELWPGGGWYTEILAPYLREKGRFWAAHFQSNSSSKYFANSLKKFTEKMSANPKVYDKVIISEFYPASDDIKAVPKGQADRVLTFRNVHNWVKGGYDKKAFEQIFQMLKPGGILGVVEHRARAGTDKDTMVNSGYVTENYVISAATAAGFSLVAKSEINANPKDPANHPKGVWTLPPRLRLGDVDREKYVAIGESDRMTLKFRKPK